MKKIIPALLFLLVLAGCSQKQATYYYGNETAEPQASGSSDTAATTSMNVPEQINQELAKEYSGATLLTNYGSIEVEFYPESPVTVSNFLTLAQKGFYNGTLFHRVIKDFMIQGGDPNSKNADRSTHGTGGPGYQFADEFNSHKLVRGSLAMANAGPSTNGSQFFIVTAPETSWLDGKHTNFGHIVAGMDVVEKIEKAETDSNDHPVKDITIEKVVLKKK